MLIFGVVGIELIPCQRLLFGPGINMNNMVQHKVFEYMNVVLEGLILKKSPFCFVFANTINHIKNVKLNMSFIQSTSNSNFTIATCKNVQSLKLLFSPGY